MRGVLRGATAATERPAPVLHLLPPSRKISIGRVMRGPPGNCARFPSQSSGGQRTCANQPTVRVIMLTNGGERSRSPLSGPYVSVGDDHVG